MSEPHPDPLVLEAAIDDALEEAGIAGLCAEGRVEAAVSAVSAKWSCLNRAEIDEAVHQCWAQKERSGRR